MRVYRGCRWGPVLDALLAGLFAWVGGYAVLSALGSQPRGLDLAAAAGVPLALACAACAVRAARVRAVLADARLEFRGSWRGNDWSVAVAEIERVYFDPHVPGAPLVVATRSEGEQLCAALARAPSEALYEALVARGAVAVSSVAPTPAP